MLAVLGLVCLTACRKGETPAPDIPVFIISIDTLRADRLPVYGYMHGSTPSIDALRADSILFEHAYAHVPLTLPSHASLFTGQLPPTHGVRDNIGYTLRGDHATLASLLQAKGYATGAAVSCWVLRTETGIGAGFDLYDDSTEPARHAARRSEERDGERTREVLEEWLDAQTSRRIFGFLHLFEPHAPYEPPSPYDSAADAYDGEVSYTDSIVGRFLDDLRARGIYDQALIILLSDHGEGLGDHGEDEHGVFLYRESIQVPLLVKLPSNERGGEVVTRPVALIDVLPTVLDVSGLEADTMLPGVSLARSLPEDRAVYAESYFPRLHLGWSELFAMVDSHHHYIHAPRPELYDIRELAQMENVVDRERRSAHGLRERLAAIDKAFIAPSDVDPEDQRRLAALGYLGSSRAADGPLPDPKDHIGSLRTFKAALTAYHGNRPAEALLLTDTLLVENPRMVDGWLLKAAILRQTGNRDGAFSTIRSGLQWFPTHPDLLLLGAETLIELQRIDEARAHAELALAGDVIAASEMLARIAIQRGDLESAAEHLEPLTVATNARPSTLMMLAEIMKKQRRYDEELRAIDRALAEIQRRRMDPVERLWYEKGIALLELRRAPEAASSFREEIHHFPADLEAWGMLAVALTIDGRPVEAREALDEAVRVNPGPDSMRMAAETLSLLENTVVR